MTVWQVVAWLEAKRAKVRSEVTELQGEGVTVVVDPESLFLCELLGLIVDLESGQIVGFADERLTPTLDATFLNEHAQGVLS